MRLALHSISYAGLWGQACLPIEPILDKAVAYGYDGVMLVAKRPHALPLDLDAEARRRLRGEIEGRGLRLAALAGYTDFGAGHDRPDVPLREMQLLYVAELARLARELGGEVVRVFTAFDRPSVPHDTLWRWCAEGLRESARRAADHGVTIAVQNHHDLAAHHESLRDLLREVDHPSCRAAFDAWSPALQGVELGTVAREMAPLTALTTAADYVRRPRYAYEPALVNYRREPDALRAVPMGDGLVDYPAFLEGLRAGGYPDDGWVAYEMCSPLEGGGSEENLDRCAGRFVDWMREHGFVRAGSSDGLPVGARR